MCKGMHVRSKEIRGSRFFFISRSFFFIIFVFAISNVYAETRNKNIMPSTGSEETIEATPLKHSSDKASERYSFKKDKNPLEKTVQITEDSPQSFQALFLKTVKGLGLCLGVLLIFFYFYKKRFPESVQSFSKRRLKILERLPVSAKSHVILLELDGKPLLCGITHESITFFERRAFSVDTLDVNELHAAAFSGEDEGGRV
jgi:flagellar biogenesis protein FliO